MSRKKIYFSYLQVGQKNIKVFIFFLVFILSILPVSGQYSTNEEILLIGDAVRIKIWELGRNSDNQNPFSNLDGDYQIDTDGNILMPFVCFAFIFP